MWSVTAIAACWQAVVETLQAWTEVIETNLRRWDVPAEPARGRNGRLYGHRQLGGNRAERRRRARSRGEST
jgi:hypothetical protein